jgi:hypothetical protein
MAQTKTVAEFQESGRSPADPPDPDEDLEGPLLPHETYSILATPAKAAIRLECPLCEQAETVTATLRTRLVRDQDGTGSLALRVRSAKAEHVCGQLGLGLAEGPRER